MRTRHFLARLFLLAFAFLTFACANAQGGPPMVTDDPGTPGNKHWEINIAYFTTQYTNRLYNQVPQADINYGYGDRVQLTLEFPYAFTDTAGFGTANGLGALTAGMKWRYTDYGDGKLQLSMYPQFTSNAFRASTRNAFVSTDQDMLLPLELADSFGPIEFDCEVGYDFHAAAPNELVYGAIIGHDFKPGPELLLEYHSQRNGGGGQQNFVNLGFRQVLTKQILLIGSGGRVISDTTGDGLTWLGYFGVQLLF